MADAIFISYRRDDSEGEAGRLFDDLTRAFGSDAVFMDVTGIKPGVDFRKAIEDNVAVCGVFLAIVGPSWATIKNSDGVRRLDDPRDFVALELASALHREVPVIPILVHDAKMPTADVLPEQLKAFSFRNSVELSHTRWSSDVQLLIEALKPYIAPPKLAVQPPVHATVPVQLPPPRPASFSMPPPARKSRMPLILGISSAVLLALILLGVVIARANKDDDKAKETEAASAPSAEPENSAASQSQAEPQQTVVPNPNAPQNPSSVAPISHPGFVGSWMSPVPRVGNSVQRLVITVSGDTLFMHPYGNCQSPECDWGEQPVLFESAAATSVFHISPAIEPDGSTTQRVVQIVATPSRGRLNLELRNQYQNSKLGPLSQIFHVTFVTEN